MEVEWTLTLLPPEVTLYAISFLSAEDVLNLSACSRYYQYLCNDDQVWKIVCNSKFRILIDGPALNEMKKARLWKQFYAYLLQSDLKPTYHPNSTVLGCTHYKRGCKLLAACCNKFFSCRFCHDDCSDHLIDRYSTKTVLCMTCGGIQPIGARCMSEKCAGRPFSRYFCNTCKFFDDEDRDIYHCPHCNICRVGKGLEIDNFHCMKCNACMTIPPSGVREHKCVENSLYNGCPVCQQWLFTSILPVIFMPCGHSMHQNCFSRYVEHNSCCPTCTQPFFAEADE